MVIAENAATHAHHHRAVTAHNRFKRRFVAAINKDFQKLSVGQSSGLAQHGRAEMLEDLPRLAVFHADSI
jgi:hypothetical protein